MGLVDDAHDRSGISKKLIRSVFRQLGGRGDELLSTLRDVAAHGADGGFSGFTYYFTYYKDTVAFFKRNKRDIVAHLKGQADDFGEDPAAMVLKFRCAEGVDAEDGAVERVLDGRERRHRDDDYDLVANCLAWYALEEVARAATDY